jgi:uncharacterized repeat protein (TIGR03803 family)
MKKQLLTLLIAILCFTSNAQYTNLFDFSGTADGSYPVGSLVSDGTYLYGMTNTGGVNNMGVVFKILPNGTNYTKLLDFNGSNGRLPNSSLIYDGTYLYGMTIYGGTSDFGVIFRIQPNGTNYTKLFDFTGVLIGAYPYGSLISDGTFLYGMTYTGGTGNMGVIFKIQTNGTNYTTLLNFAGSANGGNPYGTLVSDGTFLYGMTYSGGTNNLGVVFKIQTNGTNYTKLFDFAGITNGSYPNGSLISDGTYLYGMTQYGGTNNVGVAFKIQTNGTNYTKLFDFAGSANGGVPLGSFISDGTFLYGMTHDGGTNALGLVFEIQPNGTNFAKLLDFNGSSNGSYPNGSLLSDGTFLYGMTNGGGTNSLGTVFKLGTATGIDENENTKNGVSIYPNPFINEIKINSISSGEIILFDVKGKEILRQKTFTGETKISTEKISAGFYLFNYTDGNKTVNSKLVKF